MCDRCEGAMERRIEITDETYPVMLDETTHVALQASAAFSSQWYDAARGFLSDMSATWGSPGMVRMAYVWGAARYFLPAPPDRPENPGYGEMAELTRRLTGQEPQAQDVARLVAQADQLSAASDAVAEAASKGKPDQVADILADYAGDDQKAMNTMFLALMSEAGIRLRYSRDTGAEMGYELFMAHIRADLIDEEDDEGEHHHG